MKQTNRDPASSFSTKSYPSNPCVRLTALASACRILIAGIGAISFSAAAFSQTAQQLDLSLRPAEQLQDTSKTPDKIEKETETENKSGTGISPWAAGLGLLALVGAGGGGGGGDSKRPGNNHSTGLPPVQPGSGGAGVMVGVIDTGADISHIRIKNNVSGTHNAFNNSRDITDTDGHGTAAASLVTAVAPHVRLLISKGLGGTSAHTDRALNWAVSNGASIASLSLGATGPTMHPSIRRATAQGVLVVVAAGNDGRSVARWPAKFAGESWTHNRIIVVGALDETGKRAWFSNWDPSISQYVVFAPGVGLSAAHPGGGERSFSGTSAATPVVAGQAALIKGTWQFLPAEEIARIIFRTADRICSDGAAGAACASRSTPDPIYGWGATNIAASLRPVGKIHMRTPQGEIIDYQSTILSSGTPTTLSALGEITTVVLDEFNRGFDVKLPGAGAANPGVIPASAPVESQVGNVKFRFGLTSANSAFSSRGGTSVEFTNTRGSLSFGAGTGGAQDSFFGLASSGIAPLSLDSAANKFNAPYFSMAQNATHLGVNFGLSPGSSMRFGSISQGLAGSLETSMAGLQPANRHKSSRHILVMEMHNMSLSGGRSVLTLGQVIESSGGYLGASGQGAWAMNDAANTSFLSLAGTVPLTDRIAVSGMASMGYTGKFTNKSNSVVESASHSRSSAWSLGISAKDIFLAGDQMSVTAHMPLRMQSGSMVLNTATSQNAHDGSLNFDRTQLSLVPSGRERQLTFSYTVNLAQSTRLAVQANYRNQANHSATAGSDAGLGMRLDISF